MRKILSLLSIALLLTATSGCEPGGIASKSNVGGLAGAAGGAWIGSNIGKGKGNIVGIALGTILGGALGYSVGNSLDKADLAYNHKTSQTALETNASGATSEWVNPDSGHRGTITPVKTFTQQGKYCREFTQTIIIDGKPNSGHGVACREPDGTWKINSNS